MRQRLCVVSMNAPAAPGFRSGVVRTPFSQHRPDGSRREKHRLVPSPALERVAVDQRAETRGIDFMKKQSTRDECLNERNTSDRWHLKRDLTVLQGLRQGARNPNRLRHLRCCCRHMNIRNDVSGFSTCDEHLSPHSYGIALAAGGATNPRECAFISKCLREHPVAGDR